MVKNKEFVKKAKARLKKRRPEYMKKRVIVPIITAIILILIGIAAAVRSTYYQSTDDAFVEGRLVSVAPRVAAPVTNLLVDDNQLVKKGELLVELDSNDFQTALNQAEAKLAEAKSDLNKSNAGVNKSYEDITSAKSKLEFAKRDFARYDELYKDGIVSKQDYEKSRTTLEVAAANLNSAEENSRAAIHAAESNTALIKRLEAEVEQAKLNLQYTKIYAPQDGMVAARSVEKGNYVSVGQPLMNIVPEQVWVIANFKEIQLTNMKVNQPVSIKVDTYPGKRFKGHVDSIQRATGAKSSLFPPENAVGSYVKIVQRVPVKIVFDEDISKYNIVPGMSVVPRVRIKDGKKD